MSYRQDLRAAELAVIRAAEALTLVPADQIGWGQTRFAVDVDLYNDLGERCQALHALRSQLDAPVAPASDDDTSATAARMILPHAGSLRRSILIELHRRRHHPVPGATDDQLERALKRAHTSVSAARNFLWNTGWIVDSGERIDTSAGRPAVVWMLAPGAEDRIVEAIAQEVPRD